MRSVDKMISNNGFETSDYRSRNSSGPGKIDFCELKKPGDLPRNCVLYYFISYRIYLVMEFVNSSVNRVSSWNYIIYWVHN